MAAASMSCNDSGTADYNDSTLNDQPDSARNDTMYYERMQQGRTGNPTDSTAQNTSRNDTMYYERLQNKTHKDSSRQ